MQNCRNHRAGRKETLSYIRASKQAWATGSVGAIKIRLELRCKLISVNKMPTFRYHSTLSELPVLRNGNGFRSAGLILICSVYQMKVIPLPLDLRGYVYGFGFNSGIYRDSLMEATNISTALQFGQVYCSSSKKVQFRLLKGLIPSSGILQAMPPYQGLGADWLHYLFLPNTSKSRFRRIFEVSLIHRFGYRSG